MFKKLYNKIFPEHLELVKFRKEQYEMALNLNAREDTLTFLSNYHKLQKDIYESSLNSFKVFTFVIAGFLFLFVSLFLNGITSTLLTITASTLMIVSLFYSVRNLIKLKNSKGKKSLYIAAAFAVLLNLLSILSNLTDFIQ